VKIGPYEFPLVDYDRFADIVYLRRREGEDGESRGTTPEGHAFLYPFDGANDIIGVDLEGVQRQLESEGGVFITTPAGDQIRLVEVERLIT
jgi:hypothetical protein